MDLQNTTSIIGRFRNTFIGDRAFYKSVLTLVLPIIAQNSISNFVNLLDNIMVGQVGTAQMSGVAIVNQLTFVFFLTMFGGIAGPGIYGAQFYGARNYEGLRQTFRFKLWTVVVIYVIAVTVFLTKGKYLISLYLTGEGDPAQAAEMLAYGSKYLFVMLFGLLPFALTTAYSSTLRETGESLLPMKAGIAAVLVNLALNYILIFGKFGAPALGVVGAAIATVISRYVELTIIVIYTHRHVERFPFIKGLYSSLRVPFSLIKVIMKKGILLLLNELFWSLGVTTQTQIFSTCGLNVIAGLNISGTVTNLFNVVFISMGTAVGVMTGQALGANDIKKAKSIVWKLIFFSICTCIVIGGMLAAVSPFVPKLYNTTEDVRRLATHFMLTSAGYMAFFSITHNSYFAIRSGGKTLITFIFDSVYLWCFCIPYVYMLTHFANLSILAIYPLSYVPEVIKSFIGVAILRKGYWAQNIVADGNTSPSAENY